MTTESFLAECEARANEVKAMEVNVAEGPWEASGDGCLSGPDEEPFASFTWSREAKFCAHARTSNPDLANRVLALVKMVQERDEHVAAIAKTALLERMYELSSICYAAQWLDTLQFDLWRFILRGPGNYGIGRVDDSDIQRLKQYANAASGWFAWVGTGPESGPQFIPMAEWLVMYEERTRAS